MKNYDIFSAEAIIVSRLAVFFLSFDASEPGESRGKCLATFTRDEELPIVIDPEVIYIVPR